MKSRLNRAVRSALVASLACAATLVPLSRAQAHTPGPYRLYLETDYSDGCGDYPSFWRTTANGRLIASHDQRFWSLVSTPDGRTLAYSSGNAIQVVDAAHHNARAHATRLRGRRANWSVWPLAIAPGGQIVLARAIDYEDNFHYYLFANGRRIRTLHLHGNDLVAAAWSGTGMVAVAYHHGEAVPRIGLMTLTGRISRLHQRADYGLAWSADSSRILFSFKNNVFSMSAGGHEKRTLVHDAVLPAASPDGARLAFVRSREKSNDVWTADRNGRHQRRVARVPAWESPQSLLYAYAALPLPGLASSSRTARVSDC
jgi:hypothetical protein